MKLTPDEREEQLRKVKLESRRQANAAAKTNVAEVGVTSESTWFCCSKSALPPVSAKPMVCICYLPTVIGGILSLLSVCPSTRLSLWDTPPPKLLTDFAEILHSD